MNVLKYKKNQNKKEPSDFNCIFRGIKLVHEIMPKYIPCMLIYAVFSTIPRYTNIYFSARIIDELIGSCRKNYLMLYVVLMIGMNFIFILFSKLGWRYVRVNQIVSGDWEDLYLNQKSFQMDFELIENSKVRELRRQIEDNRNIGGLNVLIIRLMFLIQNILNLLISSVMLVGILFMFSNHSYKGLLAFANSKLSVVTLIVVTCIVSFALFYHSKNSYLKRAKKAKELSLIQKKSHFYINDYLDDSKSGKDVRIFNQENIIVETAKEMLDNFFVINKDFITFQFDIDKKISCLSLFLNSCTYIIIGFKTLAGVFTLGDMIKYISLINKFLLNILNLSDSIAKLKDNNTYLKMLYEYLDFENKATNEINFIECDFCEKEHIIEFHNVSFKYPQSEQYVLKNLSFEISSGERVAIVGMNGSGKTTLIKLLCRFYEPTSGRITIDGKDVNSYKYTDYLKIFSVIFQDFRLFSISIAQNIASNLNFDKEKVKKCLELVGLLEFINKLPKSIDTNVYRSFDESGIEISGGEAQKIAIARALYKDAPYVILDEPTANLDPISESEIYTNFNKISNSKTVIFISHRLSSCKFCDKIIVLEKGEIVQKGNHKDLLLNENGLYYQLWNAQAQYYQNQI